MRTSSVVYQLAAAMVIAQAGAAVQAPLFQPLLADPKEPRFFAGYLWARSPRLASRLGTVGFGQTIGLLRGRDWQLGIAAGVFSEFNMESSTTDLLNTDYLVGLPLTYRHGSLATRLRLYHQSSHLGDEYMVHTTARRPGIPSARLVAAPRPGYSRPPGGGAGRQVDAGPRVAAGVEHGDRARTGRSPGRCRIRLALERLAQGLHRARAVRRVLPGPRLVPRRRCRVHALTPRPPVSPLGGRKQRIEQGGEAEA